MIEKKDDISVLICDDSALMRNLISRIVDETEGLKVVGKAVQIFCEEEIVANSLNCYISDSRDYSLLNFEQQSCTTMHGCLFIKKSSSPDKTAQNGGVFSSVPLSHSFA